MSTTILVDRRDAAPVAAFSYPREDHGSDLSIAAARAIAGTLGYPSKMPGTSYGIPASACGVGGKLAAIAGSVCSDCYALKANYQYRSVRSAQMKRLRSLTHPRWVGAMVRQLSHMHSLENGKPRRGRNGPIVPGWHRWHDAGDLQSMQHLANICAVAQLTPSLWHWLPTREGGIVKRYRDAGGVIPENLCIRVSATMVDGSPPSFWPQTSGVHHDCSARFHDGKCGECRACWNREVNHVEYPLH
jgi:hypothetical protein